MWQEKNNKLENRFEFADFKSALKFVNKVGQLAESQNHHPDITFGWGYVEIVITTHSADKVTEKDHKLAQTIDAISS